MNCFGMPRIEAKRGHTPDPPEGRICALRVISRGLLEGCLQGSEPERKAVLAGPVILLTDEATSSRDAGRRTRRGGWASEAAGLERTRRQQVVAGEFL